MRGETSSVAVIAAAIGGEHTAGKERYTAVQDYNGRLQEDDLSYHG